MRLSPLLNQADFCPAPLTRVTTNIYIIQPGGLRSQFNEGPQELLDCASQLENQNRLNW